jgi:hypothetical protein
MENKKYKKLPIYSKSSWILPYWQIIKHAVLEWRV